MLSICCYTFELGWYHCQVLMKRVVHLIIQHMFKCIRKNYSLTKGFECNVDPMLIVIYFVLQCFSSCPVAVVYIYVYCE